MVAKGLPGLKEGKSSYDYRNAIIHFTMLTRFISILQQKCFLSPENKVLVGVSGGADSLFLLNLLSRSNYPFIVAHLNHQLRPEAEDDAQFVENLTGRLGIPFILGKEDVVAFAERYGLSIEEAARHLRYSFLFENAKQVGAQAVLVAHHADDQIETVLMHFLRGSGLAGLRGMQYWSLPNPWSEEIPLVRPLLEFWREEIDQYLKDQNLEPIEDKTNRDTTIFRNRLRHELIPFLTSYNPGIRKVLYRMSQVLNADYEILEGIVDSAWEEICKEQGPGYTSFRFAALSAQPVGIQRHLIRKGINFLLPGLRDIDFHMVDRALNFIKTPTNSKRMELAAGLYILLEDELLWLANDTAVLPDDAWPQLPPNDNNCIELSLGRTGNLLLDHGWRIEVDLQEISKDSYQQVLENTDMFQAWIDIEQVQFPLTIRCRRPGDRFQPAGMAGRSVKLSDFMINVKIPERARARWPLVYSASELMWVPGYRLAHSFLISDSTSQVLHLRLLRSNEA
jgi:tRNA(Ile)-lysidine synthase